MQHKYQAYVAATQTVAKTRQIVMLYDGAIRCVQQAREAIQDRRIEDRYRLLMRASDIIIGLQSCLDFENGGDVAKALYQFYASISNRIFSIHRNNSVETCEELISELKQMRDAWQDIDNQYVSAAAGAPPAPSPVASEGNGHASAAAETSAATFSA